MTDRFRELVDAVSDVWRQRDLELVMPHVREDAVYDWSRSIGPHRGVYRGHLGVRRLFRTFIDPWEEVGVSIDLTVIDDDTAVATSHLTMRGRGSGVEVSASGAQLWTLRDRQFAEVVLFQNHGEAVAAAPRWQRRRRLTDARLYFVCEGRPNGGESLPVLEAALRGGADLIQLRDKDLGDEELVQAAQPFHKAADEHGALFILNDRPDLVAACEADGVHVGQEDASVTDARTAAGPAAVVGLSTHSEEQIGAAGDAEGEGRPDYISVGPVWETPTKEGRPGTGLGLIEFAAANATLPWFTIGGIDTSNLGEVVAAGGERIVVVRAIRDAEDPEAAARQLRDAVEVGAEVRG